MEMLSAVCVVDQNGHIFYGVQYDFFEKYPCTRGVDTYGAL